MTDYLTVSTTADDHTVAARLAESAVTARVAACAQIVGPVTSVYWWEGEVRREQEWQVLFKTPATRYADLEAHIRAEHPYDVPEVIAVPIVAGALAYLTWMAEETMPREAGA